MIILGLDPSLTGFGWCIIDSSKSGMDQVLSSGVIKTSPRTYMPKRYRDLADGLDEVILTSPLPIEFVGVEHPPYGASYSMGLYALYVYVTEVLMNHRLSFVYFLPTQIKAFARGVLGDNGKMFKSDMKDAVVQIVGGKWKGKLDHNVADAFIAGYHAGRFKDLLDGKIENEDLTDKEVQAFDKTTKKRNGKIEKSGLRYHKDERYFLFSEEQYDYLYPPLLGGGCKHKEPTHGDEHTASSKTVPEKKQKRGRGK